MVSTNSSNQSENRSKIVYVDEAFPDGWRRVLINNVIRYIPEGMKLRLTGEKNDRQYFTILEGKYKGATASIKMKKVYFGFVSSSYLTTKNKQIMSYAKLFFNINEKKLYIEGLGTFDAITDINNPVPKGPSIIQIPDEPHSHYGSVYRSYSHYSSTWFRIGENGDRYLHCGNVSLGCITVTDLSSWTEIYKYLRYRRLDHMGTGVGIVRVR